jgi:hypothetical protein
MEAEANEEDWDGRTAAREDKEVADKGRRSFLHQGPKTKTLYHNRYCLSRITMLLFEWASLFEMVGYKLAEGKGLREG